MVCYGRHYKVLHSCRVSRRGFVFSSDHTSTTGTQVGPPPPPPPFPHATPPISAPPVPPILLIKIIELCINMIL